MSLTIHAHHLGHIYSLFPLKLSPGSGLMVAGLEMKNGLSFPRPFGKVFNRFLCYPLAFLFLRLVSEVSNLFVICNHFGLNLTPNLVGFAICFLFHKCLCKTLLYELTYDRNFLLRRTCQVGCLGYHCGSFAF